MYFLNSLIQLNSYFKLFFIEFVNIFIILINYLIFNLKTLKSSFYIKFFNLFYLKLFSFKFLDLNISYLYNFYSNFLNNSIFDLLSKVILNRTIEKNNSYFSNINVLRIF